ncbi:MAG TPA: thioredoxin domain-containing protein [Nitrospira sp.]|nr:thioredoxin domain-containing protein [Nitrospira sp.]
MIAEVSDREFDTVVGGSKVPVLVEFWKPGCGGCGALSRQLERLVEEVGEALVVLKMNVEENFQIPAELDISSLPALALYRGGQFERFIGGLGTKEEILRQLRLPEGPTRAASKSGRPAG